MSNNKKRTTKSATPTPIPAFVPDERWLDVEFEGGREGEVAVVLLFAVVLGLVTKSPFWNRIETPYALTP